MPKSIKLFDLSLVFLVVLIVTSLSATREFPASASNLGRPEGGFDAALPTGPTARFDYSMPDHFGSRNGAGLIDYHWDPVNQTYDQSYVNPAKWRVSLDACASSAGNSTIQSFAWEIDGQVQTTNACSSSYDFPALKTYPVKLTIRTRDGQSDSMTKNVVVKNHLIVSIGDSIASGEGNPDIPQQFDALGFPRAGPVWEDKRSHRSAKSGHAQAALRIEQSDPRTSVTFVSFACSGAGLAQGLLNGYIGAEPDPLPPGVAILLPQLQKVQETVKGRTIDALLVSVGANDVKFHWLVEKAVTDNPFWPIPYPWAGVLTNQSGKSLECPDDPDVRNWFPAALSQLPFLYDQVDQRLKDHLKVSHVFISEYPEISLDAARHYCDHYWDHSLPLDLLFNVSAKESQWASETVVRGLNQAVKAAADRHGWIYVGGIAAQFESHGFCSGNQRWIRTHQDARYVQGPINPRNGFVSSGIIHPNEAGHAVYAGRLASEFNRVCCIQHPDPLTPMTAQMLSPDRITIREGTPIIHRGPDGVVTLRRASGQVTFNIVARDTQGKDVSDADVYVGPAKVGSTTMDITHNFVAMFSDAKNAWLPPTIRVRKQGYQIAEVSYRLEVIER